MRSPRAWVVWAVAVAAYAAAVMARTTFGVAGVDAARHFGAGAGIIGLFVVVQLLVYALLQIPVGVLLDRFGPRLLIACGAFVMFLGQVGLAFADSVPSGIIGRILVGAGDAMTFGSALRLVPAWFPPRRAPLMTQLTGMLGQAGQILSAIPFAILLQGLGWRPAFLATAGVCLASCFAAALLVRDGPNPRSRRGDSGEYREDLGTKLRAVWAHPGTHLGLATHFTTSFSPLAFAMMWGYPYLTAGEGLSAPTASALMSLFVVTGLVVGPTLGVLTNRHPMRRSNLALAVVGAGVVPWVAVLAWPGPAPLWLLAVLMVGMSSGGPGSAIGFDYARTFVPAHRLGTATGIVIMGGFGGALIFILLVGLVLDAGGGYSLATFRLAMATQLPLWLAGVLAIYGTRRRARERLAHEAGVHVFPLAAAVARRLRRRRERSDPPFRP